MDYWTLFMSQLSDPFRIALLVGLALTMHRTRLTSGIVIPALAGIAFVAALIPMTMTTSIPFWPQFLTGLGSNAILLGIILTIQRIAMRAMR